MLRGAGRMHGRGVRPRPPARQLGGALVAVGCGHGVVEGPRPLLVPAVEAWCGRGAREHVAEVVVAGEAGAEDGDAVVLAEGREGLAEAEEVVRGLGGED